MDDRRRGGGMKPEPTTAGCNANFVAWKALRKPVLTGRRAKEEQEGKPVTFAVMYSRAQARIEAPLIAVSVYICKHEASYPNVLGYEA